MEKNFDFKTHKKYQNGVFKTKKEIEKEMYEKGITEIYYVLSFGGGTQSTHLLDEHFKNNIYYDYIIMSDTGAEPEFIHKQVKWWINKQKEYNNKTPFYITHHGKMKKGLEEMLFRWIKTDYQRFQLPVYCAEEVDGKLKANGLLPRQCTVEYKIIPVKQLVRQLVLKKHNLGTRQRLPKNVGFVIDIGFSADEINRINTYQSPQYKYMYLSYPLVEENLSTQASIDYLKENSMPEKRSRCYLCPFNCDKEGISWKEIIDLEPLSFLKACWIDDKLREVQKKGMKNLKSIPYLHFSRTPLREAYEDEYSVILREYKKDLYEWLNMWDNYIKKHYIKNIA